MPIRLKGCVMFTRKALQVQANKHVTAALANHLQQELFHVTQNNNVAS